MKPPKRMRKEEDGDIKPKKEDMLAAHQLLSNIIELVGEDDENAKQLINDIKELENNMEDAT
tara:strand:- start:178 stop:363 length:186 start_codon:yes stop_codon:yes gene_type:complete